MVSEVWLEKGTLDELYKVDRGAILTECLSGGVKCQLKQQKRIHAPPWTRTFPFLKADRKNSVTIVGRMVRLARNPSHDQLLQFKNLNPSVLIKSMDM